MTDRPTGTVTFLFTDIEGSTRLWEQYPDRMGAVVARHDALLRAILESYDGYVFKTVGDAFYAAFARAPDALTATLAAQRVLAAEPWPAPVGPLRVRMGLHTGTAEERNGDYFGPTLNRVARLMAAGHGGQILLSLATQELVRDALPRDAELRDLGERRLRDLTRPERVFQLVVADLPTEFPPLKTLDTRPNNLPRQATAFIGREAETAAVSALLRRPDVALVTLTGPGGTGKTRLSFQVAADLLDEFSDGVWAVELAPIREAALVPATIAAVLGVREAGGQPLVETLKAHLRDKQLLLVLDNFEQVVAAGPLVAELLATAPQVKALVSSRVALRVRGERESPVPPLALPDPSRLPPLAQLTQYEAVRLFIERASDVQPGFTVTNETAPAVAAICARLDGLPLAIELAAARTRLLSPQAILTRLDNRLKLLTGGGRDLPARQQTLRGAIAWSYDLLEPGVQQLFCRLGVFVGGATLAAVEAVCNADGDLAVDAFDGVEALLQQSLLRQQTQAADDPRLLMLETIHEYALDRLVESGESAALRAHYRRYFLAQATAAAPHLTGPEQAQWRARLEADHDNIRAVLGAALAAGDPTTVLQFGSLLWRFWRDRGHLSEGRRWLDAALAQDRSAPPATRAAALVAAGVLAAEQGDSDPARTLLLASQEIYMELADMPGLTQVANRLGNIALDQEDYPAATAFHETGLALFRDLADQFGIASSLSSLGEIAHRTGDYARATRLFSEQLDLFRRLGNTPGVAWALRSLAYLALERDDRDAATDYFCEALTLFAAENNPRGIAHCLVGYAALALPADPIRAVQLSGAVDTGLAALRTRLGPVDRAVHDRTLARAQTDLSPTAFAAAWTGGHSLAPSAAVALVLGSAGGVSAAK